jgi:predicted DNA binding protein
MTSSRWPAAFIETGGERPDHGPSGPHAAGGPTVIRARFRLALSADLWVTEVSTSFPDATLRLLTGVPKGDRALELGEVRAENAGTVAEAIRTHPDITAYDQLFVGERRAIAQYEADERGLYEFLWESSLPPEFPIVARNGEMEFDLTATQEQFEAFGAALDETGRQYELLSLVHTDENGDLLTERQRECLHAALRQGYFEVPRACTLADVAAELGVDKSTASETIRRGQARVLEEYLLGRE